MKQIGRFWDLLCRRKVYQGNQILETPLKRCLGVFDIMAVAIGHMIGAGIYVLTGAVIRNTAGPSIIFSFCFAGVAALLSAMAYAEFGARFPRAGSAYSYAYVAIGELWAFMVGWTVPLEYMIANAAIARSWSAYFDTVVDHAVKNFTISTIGEFAGGGGFFSRYMDVLACILLVIVSVVVALGSKTSARINLIFVVLNITILSFIIINNFIYADFSNWFGVNEKGINKFFPYGFSGTLSGSSTCFYAFIGFEALATAGEEAKNPHRTIPVATISSVALTFVLYTLMGASLSLVLPYDQIDPDAAYAEAFKAKGATVARYVVTIGALTGLLNNMITSSFALPRSCYALAEDGLIFKFIAKINKKTQIPLNAVIVFMSLNILMTLFFDIEALVEFWSIGTLMAYSIVTACVIILRYQPAPIETDDPNSKIMDNGGSLHKWVPYREFWETQPAGRSISVGVTLFTLFSFALSMIPRLGIHDTIYGYVLLAIFAILLILSFVFILGHKENSTELSYKVPFLPYLPCLGLLINAFLMVYLKGITWLRLIIWLAIGLVIYFTYGIRHSKEGRRNKVAIAMKT